MGEQRRDDVPRRPKMSLASRLEGKRRVRKWMCVICRGCEIAKREGRRTDLDDDRGGGVHDDPGGPLRGRPKVLVDDGGVRRVQGGVVCGGHLDGEIVEHVGPVLALAYGGRKDDKYCGRDGYKEGCDAGELEDIVGAGEGPVILCGEYEVEEEDGGEGEGDAGDEDLDGEGLDKGGPVAEDGVLGIRVVLGLGHRRKVEEQEHTS